MLMLQCVECCATGTIDDPTEQEWSEAYYAPARAYLWTGSTTITPRGFGAPRVIRAIDGRCCNCPSQLSLGPLKGYERFPGGIAEHSAVLSDEEKVELN